MTNLQENPLRVVTIRSLALMIVVDAIIYFVLGDSGLRYIYGTSLGMLVSVLGFHLINLSLKKSLEYDQTKAALLHRRDQMLRNLLYMIVLVIAIKLEFVDPFSTALGLLVVRIVIQSDSVINWFKLFYKKEV